MKELLSRLTICSFCILTICKFSYVPFWFLGLNLGSGCFSSWSLLTIYSKFHMILSKMLNVIGFHGDIFRV